MTYDALAKIVTEIIARLDVLMAIRVGVFSLDAENDADVGVAAELVNGKCSFLDYRDLGSFAPCDILFMDKLPTERVPNLALGISRDVLEAYLNRVILSGGRVFVLHDAELSERKVSPVFSDLKASYVRTLTSYGYISAPE
jgi:hypothetical protein